jgi:HPr kinase/phosphorylase
VAYLTANVGPDVVERRIQRIVTLEPPVIIVADGQHPPDRLVACATAPRSRCSPPSSRPAT